MQPDIALNDTILLLTGMPLKMAFGDGEEKEQHPCMLLSVKDSTVFDQKLTTLLLHPNQNP